MDGLNNHESRLICWFGAKEEEISACMKQKKIWKNWEKTKDIWKIHYITKFSHPKIWVLEAENRTVGRRKIIKEIIEENVMSWKKDYGFQNFRLKEPM